MPQFTIRPLEPGEISSAFPLVRVAAPELDPGRWGAFAGWLIVNGGGVLGLWAEDSTLLGVAAYRPCESLRHGRMLQVELAVTFELRSKAPGRAALHAALDEAARALGCDSLGLVLAGRGYADRESSKTEAWRALGLELDSVSFVKRLAPIESGEPAAATAALAQS